MCIGKRRKLLKKYFQLQAAEEIQKEELEDLPLPDSISTEYTESFCDSNFRPLMENDCNINVSFFSGIHTKQKLIFSKLLFSFAIVS